MVLVVTFQLEESVNVNYTQQGNKNKVGHRHCGYTNTTTTDIVLYIRTNLSGGISIPSTILLL